MIINIYNESIIVLFLCFLLFSYTMKYISIFLNLVYNSNLKMQNELYESGGPVYYKQDSSLNLQSYLLAVFFLLFELELFLTYPILFKLFSNPVLLNESMYNYVYHNYILNEHTTMITTVNIEFFSYFRELSDSFLMCFIIFFLNLIAALALEWSFGGLAFTSNKSGKFNFN